GHPRDEPEDEPADDEQDGIRHSERRRDDEHRRDRQDEAELDEPVTDLQMHRRILPAPWLPAAGGWTLGRPAAEAAAGHSQVTSTAYSTRNSIATIVSARNGANGIQ